MHCDLSTIPDLSCSWFLIRVGTWRRKNLLGFEVHFLALFWLVYLDHVRRNIRTDSNGGHRSLYILFFGREHCRLKDAIEGISNKVSCDALYKLIKTWASLANPASERGCSRHELEGSSVTKYSQASISTPLVQTYSRNTGPVSNDTFYMPLSTQLPIFHCLCPNFGTIVVRAPWAGTAPMHVRDSNIFISAHRISPIFFFSMSTEPTEIVVPHTCCIDT